MNRRKFIVKSGLGLLGIGASMGLYTWQVEPFWLEFVKRKLPVKNLPDSLIGKTLMQISDIHVGNKFPYQYLIDSLKKAKTFNPDIVVYTGDYVTYENEKQFEQLDKVMEHAVRGKLGTYGILGNHDWGYNWSEAHVAMQVSSQLEHLGVEMLHNARTEINGLHIIGIDDLLGLNFYPEKVMQAYVADTPAIVLCHNPDACDLDIWYDYQGWILAGHTHGGQCKPPFFDPPILPVQNKRYTSGEFSLDDGRKVYINRALGHSMQVRFNVRPEITLFELQRVI